MITYLLTINEFTLMKKNVFESYNEFYTNLNQKIIKEGIDELDLIPEEEFRKGVIEDLKEIYGIEE